MFEVKVTVDLLGIPEAINNLADALRGCGKFTPGATTTSAGAITTPAIVNNGSGAALAEVHGGLVINQNTKEKKPEEKPALAPVEPVEEQPPLAEVPTTEPEPSFIGDVPPDEPEPAPVKKYTFKQISNAGAKLCAEVGKMEQLVTLLNTKYGVPAITMIPEEKYGELAADLIALGAVMEEG